MEVPQPFGLYCVIRGTRVYTATIITKSLVEKLSRIKKSGLSLKTTTNLRLIRNVLTKYSSHWLIMLGTAGLPDEATFRKMCIYLPACCGVVSAVLLLHHLQANYTLPDIALLNTDVPMSARPKHAMPNTLQMSLWANLLLTISWISLMLTRI